MRFYTETHTHCCGIDLHARTMYLCILDREGEILLHKNIKCRPEDFLSAVAPFRDDLVVSRSSASSRGTGSPTCAAAKGSSSYSATPST